MKIEFSIPRHDPIEDPRSLESLRQKGIRLAQEFSGHHWTDYNLHDPGITILEQFCYALTELIHLSDAPVADYLADAQGTIDTLKQALNLPEHILTCRPTTQTDLLVALLDALPELVNVDVQTQPPGLYRLIIHCAPIDSDLLTDPDWKYTMREHVRRIYYTHRNLCEDLAEVRHADEVSLDLQADIEVTAIRQIPEILVQIFSRATDLLSGSIPMLGYEEALQQEHDLEQVFRGPHTRKGVFLTDPQRFSKTEVSEAAIYSLIHTIPGIRNILSFSVLQDNGHPLEADDSRPDPVFFRLNLPDDPEHFTIHFFYKGRPHTLTQEEINRFRSNLEKLRFRSQSKRSTDQDPSALYQVPTGNSEGLGQYHSIQHHFPSAFGLGSESLADSVSKERRAQAAQLKAYLMIFEQVMANYQSDLSQAHQLFSVENENRRSYFFQVLDNSIVPKSEGLYGSDPAPYLAKTLEKQDRYYERKGRVLDYLLGLYGEKFAQNSLRPFFYFDPPESVRKRLVANKLRYLKAVIEVGKHRFAGRDYTQPLWPRRLKGFELKLGLRLGMDLLKNRSLVQPMNNLFVTILTDEQFWKRYGSILKGNFAGIKRLNHESVEFHEPLPRLTSLQRRSLKMFPINLENLSRIQSAQGLVYAASIFFAKGMDGRRYRLVRLKNDSNFHLVFQADYSQKWWVLGVFPERDYAIRLADWLLRGLRYLNRVSEGFHVVEHVLLRPLSEVSSKKFSNISVEFYAFRMSVVFPNWTARCQDLQYRKFTTQVLQEHCPAHIRADVLWLDPDLMAEFETLYQAWDRARRANVIPSPKEAEACDQTSLPLILFLQKHRSEQESVTSLDAEEGDDD